MIVKRFCTATVAVTAACLTLAIAGCSPQIPDGLMAVTGSVTFQGEPVSYGEVVFEPDAERGNRGPQSRCPINNGAYATRAGFGAPIGPVLVFVRGFSQPPVLDYLPTAELFKPHTLKAVLDPKSPRLDITVPTP